LLSVFYECTQLLTGIGIFDVDDMILNTSGTLVGVLIFYGIKSLFAVKPKKSIHETAPSSAPN